MKNWKVAQKDAEKRRLAILVHLRETPNYEASADILAMAVKSWGARSELELMREAFEFLHDAELVVISDLPQIKLVKITLKGIEVSTGTNVVEGVERPGPAA